MTFLTILAFAVIEGLTEFLPVSSTAHLLILSGLLGIAQTPQHIAFEISIQCGAILAALVLERRSLLSQRILLLTLAAFIPTAIIGFLLHDVVTTLFMGTLSIVLLALFIGGVVLILFSFIEAKIHVSTPTVERMSLRQAVLIGISQALALIPGVSRSAATVVTAQSLGLSRTAAVEFSFLLAIPTMGAATALDLFTSADVLRASDFVTIGLGAVLSFVVALGAMKWFLGYVRSHSLAVFGVYRIVFSVLILGWLLY